MYLEEALREQDALSYCAAGVVPFRFWPRQTASSADPEETFPPTLCRIQVLLPAELRLSAPAMKTTVDIPATNTSNDSNYTHDPVVNLSTLAIDRTYSNQFSNSNNPNHPNKSKGSINHVSIGASETLSTLAPAAGGALLSKPLGSLPSSVEQRQQAGGFRARATVDELQTQTVRTGKGEPKRARKDASVKPLTLQWHLLGGKVGSIML